MARNNGFQFRKPRYVVKNYSRRRFLYDVWVDDIIPMVAALALLVIAPLFLLVYIIQRLTGDSGPFLFKQQRTGYKGKKFTIYKIRTMSVGAEKSTSLGTNDTSPQVTTLGRILRKLKIDELPQLYNILNGDMTLVGPRPIPIKLEEELSKNILQFDRRFEVKGGLTSIGQICVYDNGLEENLIEDWKIRFHGELHYIENQSITYDIVLIVMTVIFIIKKLIKK